MLMCDAYIQLYDTALVSDVCYFSSNVECAKIASEVYPNPDHEE